MAPKILVVDDNAEFLSLLVGLLEQAGYSVVSAGKGKHALEAVKNEKPQLAVLDILLPDMMGYHLADALRKDQPLLPLIFMSGVFKGGTHATEARQKYAAAAYFEKPFDGFKLLEAIAKQVPLETEPQEPESVFEVDLDVDVEEEESQDVMELTGRVKVAAEGNVTAELRGSPLTAIPLKKIIENPRPIVPPPPKPQQPVVLNRVARVPSRWGELKDNLPALLTAFYLSKETGELGIQKGKVKKVIYFEKGQPIFALSNLLADRFGQFLVRVGKIRPEQVQDAAAAAAASNRRTGDVLIERGLLKETERLYFVAQQVKSIIYSLFGWEEGVYIMNFKERSTQESIKLDVHPANLIARGVRKIYKPERLRRLIHPEDRFLPGSASAYQLTEVELEKWEAELLPKIDGNRTVAELIALTHRPEQVMYGFIAAMKALGILERRESLP